MRHADRPVTVIDLPGDEMVSRAVNLVLDELTGAAAPGVVGSSRGHRGSRHHRSLRPRTRREPHRLLASGPPLRRASPRRARPAPVENRFSIRY